jgi:hypothetical protein
VDLPERHRLELLNPGDPLALTEFDDVVAEEPDAGVQGLVVRERLQPGEVPAHHLLRHLGAVIEVLADGGHEAGERLDVLLGGRGPRRAEQVGDARVQNLLRDHLLLEELADEPDVAHRAQLDALRRRRALGGIRNRRKLRPRLAGTLELLLAGVQQDAPERHRLAIGRFPGELGKLLGQTKANVGVHAAKAGLPDGLVEHDGDRVRQRRRGRDPNLEQLLHQPVELLGGDLVEDGLDRASHLGAVVVGAAAAPSVGRLDDRGSVGALGERREVHLAALLAARLCVGGLGGIRGFLLVPVLVALGRLLCGGGGIRGLVRLFAPLRVNLGSHGGESLGVDLVDDDLDGARGEFHRDLRVLLRTVSRTVGRDDGEYEGGRVREEGGWIDEKEASFHNFVTVCP